MLPIDTQKNTAFAYAKRHIVSSPEDYAIAFGRRFLEPAPKVDSAQTRVEQYPGERTTTAPDGHDHAFVRRGDRTRTTVDGTRTTAVTVLIAPYRPVIVPFELSGDNLRYRGGTIATGGGPTITGGGVGGPSAPQYSVASMPVESVGPGPALNV